MIVYGQKHGEDVGAEIFRGSYEECKEHIKGLSMGEFEHLTIDEDNGVIKEWIVSNGKESV